MKKSIYSTILFLFLNLVLFGQTKIKKDTVFIDENMKEISLKVFEVKCGAAAFHCKMYETDKLIVYAVLNRINFGKITPKEYNQIRLYLNNKSIKNTPKNHKILIHYEEALAGFQESNASCNLVNSKTAEENFEAFNADPENKGYEFESLKQFQNHANKHATQFHSKKVFDKEIAEYASSQNKCIKKVEMKHQTPVYYVVNENYGYPLKNEHFTWIVDTGVIKNAFFKIDTGNDLVIIKPNGEYFMKSGNLPDFVLSKILKADDWSQFINDWERSKETNNFYGYGIIFNMTKEYEFYSTPCY